MNKENVSFLIQCDEKLNITDVYWYHPVFLISPYQTTLESMFCEKEKEHLRNLVGETFTQDEVMSCGEEFMLASPKVSVSLCMMSSHKKILIHGFDTSEYNNDEALRSVKTIIHNFMKVIKDSSSDLITSNEKTIRTQFEEIQKLNNNLLNIQRQFQKANIKLNQLNSDLNNRLVKDSLTGLVSRYQYREEIDILISKDPNKFGIFTFIDLDDFKSINDTLGHRAGDEYLKEFGARLKKLSFENIICMRIAGDEFGLYIHGYDDVTEDDINKIWEEMQEKVLKYPIVMEQNQIEVLCSAGMAIYGKDTTEIYDLIEYADFAMYEVKNTGKNSYMRFNLERYKNKPHSIL